MSASKAAQSTNLFANSDHTSLLSLDLELCMLEDPLELDNSQHNNNNNNTAAFDNNYTNTTNTTKKASKCMQWVDILPHTITTNATTNATTTTTTTAANVPTVNSHSNQCFHDSIVSALNDNSAHYSTTGHTTKIDASRDNNTVTTAGTTIAAASSNNFIYITNTNNGDDDNDGPTFMDIHNTYDDHNNNGDNDNDDASLAWSDTDYTNDCHDVLLPAGMLTSNDPELQQALLLEEFSNSNNSIFAVCHQSSSDAASTSGGDSVCSNSIATSFTTNSSSNNSSYLYSRLAASMKKTQQSRLYLEQHIKQRASLAGVLRDIEKSQYAIERHLQRVAEEEEHHYFDQVHHNNNDDDDSVEFANKIIEGDHEDDLLIDDIIKAADDMSL